ncbi:MAG: peptidoglycan-associated lipoprotein Pal [Myxococcota bacterium]|nr:peptidoglycan-associated lipoprotein Pal [Myxococcota bacterium]
MGQRVLLGLALVALVACQTPGTGSSSSSTGFPEETQSESSMPTAVRSTSVQEMASSGGQLQSIYFDFNRSSLNPDARDILRSNAKWLGARSGTDARIEGNCDARGSAEYNLALGERRALAAKQYLIDLGVDASRLSTISYGEERPAVRGQTEAAYARNRRDEFVPASR